MDKKIPDILYHYTNQDGLLGILEDNKLRATSIFYLNDTMEFNYSIDLFKTYIEEIRNEMEEPRKAGEVGLSIFLGPRTENEARNGVKLSFLDNLLTLIDIYEKFHIFVCSFSEEPDLLSQWRGYCSNGNGFSLGFRKAILSNISDKNNFNLVPCIYRIDEQKKIIKQIIDKYIEKLSDMIIVKKEKGSFSATAKDEYKRLKNDFIFDFVGLAPQLKHEKFEEEKEWRLISFPPKILDGTDEKIKYRKGTSVIVPYMDIELKNKVGNISLDRLYIGPTAHKELSKISVNGLLRSKEIYSCEIVSSEIPYRIW